MSGCGSTEASCAALRLKLVLLATAGLLPSEPSALGMPDHFREDGLAFPVRHLAVLLIPPLLQVDDMLAPSIESLATFASCGNFPLSWCCPCGVNPTEVSILARVLWNAGCGGATSSEPNRESGLRSGCCSKKGSPVRSTPDMSACRSLRVRSAMHASFVCLNASSSTAARCWRRLRRQFLEVSSSAVTSGGFSKTKTSGRLLNISSTCWRLVPGFTWTLFAMIIKSFGCNSGRSEAGEPGAIEETTGKAIDQSMMRPRGTSSG
mmetsp:Transcript_114866/g.245235  ORF Transcript_114866/g.245235 Transcript_114866/m.245235 type:complete len:264 (-) Transcript_114866:237-1028(-)